jgi:hypothetical protein
MKFILFLWAAAIAFARFKGFNLDETSHISLKHGETAWASISSTPSSGFVWYSPSTQFVIQEDPLGFYESGSQHFQLKLSDQAEKGSLYKMHFYHLDANFNNISTYKVSVQAL